MASMAAAIAASRTAVLNGNRPLDERERKRFSYFSSLNPMARKIMAEKERIRERYGPEWERLPPRQQDEIIDKSLVQPNIQARYAAHRGAARDNPPPVCYPNLRLNTGQKVVRFGDEICAGRLHQSSKRSALKIAFHGMKEKLQEHSLGVEKRALRVYRDITWQDEHSAPFSWETKSQMEFSIASLLIQEPGATAPQHEQKQPSKIAPGPPAPKPSQAGKPQNSDGVIPAKKEEESSFWKINAERSKYEGEQSEFHSLTPSQIKSMEKGEKTLQPYYRQESGPKEASKAEKPSAPKPEKAIAPVVPTTPVEWEKPPSNQPAVSAFDAPSDPAEKLSSAATQNEDAQNSFVPDLQGFGQSNANNVILKTGFDFLDNW